MNITVTNELSIPMSDLPSHIRQRIVDDLTLDNPPYQTALRLGYSTYGIDPTIKLYRAEDGSLYMPRGYIVQLRELLNQTNTPYTVDDKRLWLPMVHIESSIELRDYQIPAVEALVHMQQGGVVAPCGSGKTQMGLEAIARTEQPALWITHTKELALQVISRAESVFGMSRKEIGMLGGGKWRVGERLTVALVQTLAKRDLSEIVQQFGCIILDEAHHCPASTWHAVINQFPAAYRFWLSATPDRADGLTEMLYHCAGAPVYEVSREVVPTITPALRVIDTAYDYSHDNYTIQISNLIANRARNELIVKTIAANAKGHYSLVLSERLDHLKTLRTMLRKALPKLSIEILHGELKKVEREALMERIRNREVDIVLAIKIAKEGLDIPHLDQLFLTCPKRAAATVEQEVGRIARPCQNKDSATVFDFHDIKNGLLRNQFAARCAVYGKLRMRRTGGVQLANTQVSIAT